tara:strand:- start:6202 stop:7968 length:1767 start_codon:yes stop_codon:yes gene_type:complete
MSGANSLEFDLADGQPLATEITNNWQHWNGSRQEWRSRVEENKKYVLATSTTETTNVQNNHSHSTHVPKIAQISDNLMANYMSALFPHDDWLRFEGHDEDSEAFDKKQAVLAYISTKNKLNNFRNTIQEIVNDWIIYGNGFAGVTYKQETHTDPITGETVPGYIGPHVYRISPDDIVFNPLATDFEHSPKIIRTLKSLAELHRDLEENPELGYSAEIIQTIQKNREVLKQMTDTAIDKHVQMQFDGFGSPSLYYKSGYVEVLEFYGDIYDTDSNTFLKNHVVTVVDRQYVIRKAPLNTWSGRPNIFHVGWRLRPDNLWAMGPLDNLVGMQYLVNHLENSRADAFDQMLDPDRVFMGDVEQERRGSAVDYHVTDPSIGGDVKYLGPDTTVLNADFQIERKEQQMEEYAGAPREAMGIRTPGEKTKFEVQSLQNGASRIFQSKITYFEEQFLERIINAEIEVARQYLNTTDVVRILDDDFGVTEFLKIAKEDLMANGRIVPVGARHFARQATLSQELLQLQQVLQMDPMMAQHFPAENLAKTWEDLLGFKRLELFDKFGRLNEELEFERLRRASEEQVEVESQIPIDEPI